MKNFKNWHNLKTEIDHNKPRPPFFYEREIWFCTLGLNIGHEQDGTGKDSLRPIIIMKKLSNDMCLAIPLTTKDKNHIYSFKFNFKNIRNVALIDQMRVIDTKRLAYKHGTLNQADFSSIKEKTKQMIA